MIRYGKSAGPLLGHKRDFFARNDALLAESRRLAEIYARQPRRTACMCCAGQIAATPSFTKQGIGYVICARCGHLNGIFQDTDAFCAAVYTDDGGAAYAGTYSAADRDAFRARVRDIYLPKAEFLRDALAERGLEPSRLAYADLGAGSGYFVSALAEIGCERVEGHEVSAVQTELAAAMLGEGLVRRHELDELVIIAAELEADVVSMIGVLEHVQRPRDLLAALRGNGAVRFLFISVPLFSPCVFFEMAFPEIMQRQLSGGHSHLYTEKSLDWTCAEFDLARVAEWWFGTDMVDLFRCVSVTVGRCDELAGMGDAWTEMFAPAIDDLQRALDQRHMASEVHMLLEFAR